jgi:hypothetical protein
VTEQENQPATRQKYEQEIEARELQLEEIAVEIGELDEKLEDARAAAIVGDGKIARVNELKAKIEESTKLGCELQSEINALRKRLASFDQQMSQAEQRRTVEERVVPNAMTLVDACHRAEKAAVELGRALTEVITAGTATANAWPIPNLNVPTRFLDAQALMRHVWAKVCAQGDGVVPYMALPAPSASAPQALNFTGRDVFEGPVGTDEPMIARMFAARWYAALKDEAGMPGAAENLRARIVEPSRVSKRSKAA